MEYYNGQRKWDSSKLVSCLFIYSLLILLSNCYMSVYLLVSLLGVGTVLLDHLRYLMLKLVINLIHLNYQ